MKETLNKESAWAAEALTPADQEDWALMARVARGDEPAFRMLVARHQTAIYELCYRYLGHVQDAEEVAQDVFIRLFRSAATWEPRAKLSTYLYRIAVNLSLNRIRDRKRRRLFSLDQVHEDGSTTEYAAPDTVRPDVLLEDAERRRAVRAAVARLPEKQRTVVILRRYHELSYQEIAEVMGCSVQSVESRLFRARQRLKTLMEKGK